MYRRPPRATRTDTLVPYTTLFRSGGQIACRTLGIFGLPRESVLAIAPPPPTVPATVEQARELRYVDGVTPAFTQHLSFRWGGGVFPFRGGAEPKKIGRESCRERGGQYV